MTQTSTRAYEGYDMQRQDIDNAINANEDESGQVRDDAPQGWTATPKWILAGKATFTVSNPQGEHYTFRCCKVQNEGRGPAWFVKLLAGPDNDDEGSYLYLGMLVADNGTVRLTKASKMGDDAIPVKVVRWALKRVWAGQPLPEGYSLDHDGTCARCGRTLTRPEGTRADGFRFGFGPRCWELTQQGL